MRGLKRPDCDDCVVHWVTVSAVSVEDRQLGVGASATVAQHPRFRYAIGNAAARDEGVVEARHGAGAIVVEITMFSGRTIEPSPASMRTMVAIDADWRCGPRAASQVRICSTALHLGC